MMSDHRESDHEMDADIVKGQEEEEEEEEEDEFDYDYYNVVDNDQEWLEHEGRPKDNELLEYECLTVEEVERLLNESVEVSSSHLNINPSLAKVLLYTHKWDVEKILEKEKKEPNKILIDAKIKAIRSSSSTSTGSWTGGPIMKSSLCNICLHPTSPDLCAGLSCNHLFCRDCWCRHLECQVKEGISTRIECMAQGCHILAPEDFSLSLITRPEIREKYQQFAFSDYIKSHPQLRFCPGINCSIIIRSPAKCESRAKRVICKHCKTSFCFKCGADYHAPTDCNVIRKWLTKCADDSETANYISAHTKDCPKCHICIEKNGGCNHMQCYTCKHDFCWMCLGDWKNHGSEYYECSRYKENPNIANESVHVQAREALKKYLFYYERWENHVRSLRLEEENLSKIKEKIQEKVMANKGTWIDWQYLIDAAVLLNKCRYTLQYTYPYAYFMESGPRKQLFEYQQAQLEAEIENLSWKVERAETTDRGDLQNQMDVAEKRRTTLLKDFYE